MAVYVDPADFPWRGMKWAHLWGDTLPELHAFARRLGLRREWFQEPPKASWRHYDVVASKRLLAIRLGAIETDRYGAIEWEARRKGDTRKLEMIARVRAGRAVEQDLRDLI